VKLFGRFLLIAGLALPTASTLFAQHFVSSGSYPATDLEAVMDIPTMAGAAMVGVMGLSDLVTAIFACTIRRSIRPSAWVMHTATRISSKAPLWTMRTPWH